MKAKTYDSVKTLVEVTSEFKHRVYPEGTIGTVIECYATPEAYAVDLAISSDTSVTGCEYDNVYLVPDQFEVVQTAPIE